VGGGPPEPARRPAPTGVGDRRDVHANRWEVAFQGAQGVRDFSSVGGHHARPEPWDEGSAGQYGERGSSPSNLAPGRYAFRAAIDDLSRWARDWKEFRAGRRAADQVRRPPPPGASTATGSPCAVIPTARPRGSAASGARRSGGHLPGRIQRRSGWSTTAFDRSTLAALYPSHDAYVPRCGPPPTLRWPAASCCRADRDEWLQRVAASPIGAQ